MKFLVDSMPKTCEECEYKAPAMMMSPLGVQKEVMLCTLQMSLKPPLNQVEEPNALDIKKSPEENGCLCTDGKKASSLILE